MNQPIIYSGEMAKNALAGQVAVVTGGGKGIGYEAARSLALLGATVIIAEIDKKGRLAAERINQELGSRNAVSFIQTDVGRASHVRRLAASIMKKHGCPHIIINNATIAPLGLVIELPIKDWDVSYRVNLRGPVLLAKAFIPKMIQKDRGAFICITSEGLTCMAAYESIKAAQVHLARTLDAELEGTGVAALTIGPGFVPTDTANAGIEKLGDHYGKPLAEMKALVEEHTLSVEAAGAAFAAAAVFADRFKGQEIGAKQALFAAGIDMDAGKPSEAVIHLSEAQREEAYVLCRRVRKTIEEQAQGWEQRSIFERQWMFRAFKKNAGMPVSQWQEALLALEDQLSDTMHGRAIESVPPLRSLVGFYVHTAELARGYIKDQDKLAESLKIIDHWASEAKGLQNMLNR